MGWNVAKLGYRVERRYSYYGSSKIDEYPQKFLVPNAWLGAPIQVVYPLLCKDLPQEFAAIAHPTEGISDNQIINFANKWGSLGGELQASVPSSKIGEIYGHDLIDTWRDEIRMVQCAINLAALGIFEPSKAFQVDDTELEKRVFFDEKYAIFTLDRSSKREVRQEEYPELWKINQADARVAIARLVFSKIVNEGLKNRIEHIILPIDSIANLDAFILPTGLIGAIWYLLSQIATKDFGYRKCKKCGEIFRPKRVKTQNCNTKKCTNKHSLSGKNRSSKKRKVANTLHIVDSR